MYRRASLCVLAGLLAASGASARTQWEKLGQGQLEIRSADLQSPKASVPSVVPLRHTDVKVQVRGFVAEVTVTQEFHNGLDRPIEAEYVFPLPHDAAVNATEMRVGDRVIRGKIDRREEARKTYEQARDAGKRASLLEQERANIFTQSVANIGPGETVHVVIRYVQTLPYADGSYELVFPMVVGPRYIPGGTLRDEDGRERRTGTGRKADTDRVPDASRITPPVLKPHQRCGYDIALCVDLDMGVPVQGLRSRAHEVQTERAGESKATVRLARKGVIPNKDFVLNIDTAGTQPEAGLLAHHDGKSGYFTLVLQPPERPGPEQVRPREIICVMDVSGSMTGRPIALSKKAAARLLKGLRPSDRFNVYVFSSDVSSFRGGPVEATAANVAAGVTYVQQLSAGGGTEMLKGVRAALSQELPEEVMRIVVFLTDGYIGNEEEILGEIHNRGQHARWFSFGVGSSVNRYLLDRMALAGRGTVQYVLLDDDPDEAIDAFLDRLASPVLTDVSVRFDGAKVGDLIPRALPDVFAGRPIYLYGRYDEPGKATVEIAGRIGAEPSMAKLEVQLPAAGEGHSPLPSIWARQRIKELELEKLGATDPNAYKEQITELALEYSLMSAYTSFVAVDETPTGHAGRPKRVPVSVPMPEGVSYEATIQAPAPVIGGGGVPSGGSGAFSFGPGGGGPVGPVALGAIGVLAAIEWCRRRRR